LTTVTGTLPHPVSLANINHSGDTVSLSGGATDELAVLDYARNLDGSGRFSQVVISSMRRTEDGGMGFTLVLRKKG
ncbi:MAG: PilN domain-containing protein, partial [Chloroflexota bacterium]